MAPPDLPWPAGYPYIATEDYEGQGSTVSMSKGTTGEVVESRAGWVWVTMPYLKPQRQGYVPLNRIEIGNSRKFGDVKIDVKLPEVRASTGLTGNQQPLFQRTLHAFLQGLRDNADVLHFLPPWLTERLNKDQSRLNMANAIVSAMRPAVLNILNSGRNFTIQDIINALEPVQPGDERGSVYTRIYYDFQSDRQRPPSQYVGKTVSIGKRDSEHNRAETKLIHSNHYRNSRDARSYIMGPLCYLNDPHLLAVAEQCFVCLFETYANAVLMFRPRVEQSTNAQTAVDVDKAATWYEDKEAACVLLEVARDAFAKSGWPGGRFRASYGASDGCNWNSPITEVLGHERLIWVKQEFEEHNIAVYRRPPIRITAADRGTKRVFITQELPINASLASTGNFSPNISASTPRIPPGTWVYPIIEMTIDSSPHHRSWTRLPSHGPWYDWDAARSWALKLEWQNEKGS